MPSVCWNYLAATQLHITALQAQLPLSPTGQKLRIRHHHCYQTCLEVTKLCCQSALGYFLDEICFCLGCNFYLQAVSMNKELCHRITPGVDVLYLLRCDVLPLSQFKDVLFPVHNLQGAVLETHNSAAAFGAESTKLRKRGGGNAWWWGSAAWTYWKPFPNISSVNPTVCVNRLCCLFWVFQVAFEHVWTFDAHLETSR